MDRTWEMIGAPFDLSANEAGSADAPQAVRDGYVKRWQTRFGRHYQIRIEDGGDVIVPPTVADGNDVLPALERFTAALSDRVSRCCADGHTPLVIGGDHSIAIGSVGGAARHLVETKDARARLGLLWIDAHADLNTDEGGNLHGRAAAVLLGHGPASLVGLGGRGPKVRPEDLIEIGVQELMPSEHALIKRYGIRALTIGDVEREGMIPLVADALRRLADQTDAFWLSLDIDAAAGETFGACAAPMVGGLTARELQTAVDLAVHAPGFLGLDLVEYCPAKDEDGHTLALITNLLHAALGYTRRIQTV